MILQADKRNIPKDEMHRTNKLLLESATKSHSEILHILKINTISSFPNNFPLPMQHKMREHKQNTQTNTIDNHTLARQ